MPTTIKHMPGLDGLRGIAVLAVVLFHTALTWGTNGYVGVDIFFVLSGYLITRLLLAERRQTGTISLRRFYVRRVLRLYPALAVTCVAVLLLGLAAHRLSVIGPSVVASAFYYANWWLYTGHDMVLLDHTWTLSIEEHLYAIWPAVV